MQEITYASKSIITTDEISDCLLELVTAIGRQEHSEAVTVPAFTDTGRQVEAKMTIDAGSELVVVPVDLDIDDSFDKVAVQQAVDDIRARIAKVTHSSTAMYTTPGDERADWNIDDLN